MSAGLDSCPDGDRKVEEAPTAVVDLMAALRKYRPASTKSHEETP